MKTLLSTIAVICYLTVSAQYISPNTSQTLSLQDLVEDSDGAVLFSNGAYEIYEDITISITDTLVIENEFIKVDQGVLITVEGGFYSSTSSFLQIICCDAYYEGFRFEETAVAEIFNTSILYGGGIQVLTGNFRMEGSSVSFHSTGQTTGAALDLSAGKPEIINCTFQNNQVAAIGSAANAAVAPVIVNCTFNGNVTENSNRPQVNLGPSGADTTFVSECNFIGNTEHTMVGGFAFSLLAGGEGHLVFSENSVSDNRYGMTVFGANVTSLIVDNAFTDNNTQNEPFLGGSGISISGFGENNHVILGNVFSGNLWGVTLLSDPNVNMGEIDNPEIGPGENLFADNGNGGEVYALFNNSPNTVMAQGNCWDTNDGSPTLEEAEAVISHVADDAELGEVIFDPIGMCIFVSTEDAAPSDLTLYPNPASSRIFIESDFSIQTVELFDLNGRRMYSAQLNLSGTNALDLGNLDSGFYIVQLKTERGTMTKKLTISQ